MAALIVVGQRLVELERHEHLAVARQRRDLEGLGRLAAQHEGCEQDECGANGHHWSYRAIILARTDLKRYHLSQ